jgi:hypothetical protein
MENQLIQSLPQEVTQIALNVSPEKRSEVQRVLNHVFNGVSKMREQLESFTVTDENDKVNMKLANTIRLGVRQIRLEAEKTFDAKRADVQQQMLSYKTEDQLWLKAKQTMQILTKEIEENARWKEETKQRFELEQKELKIQQRILIVSKFAPEMQRSDFENMSDESFELFVFGIEKQYNDKIEAERKEEEERIAKAKAEAEAREKQRLENERLKAEADKREKEIEAERKANEQKLAKAKAEADRIEAENKAKLKAEQEAKAKIEAELKAKIEAERKAETERKQLELKAKAEAEKLSKAPIKKQLSKWVDGFSISEIDIENDKKTLIKEKFEAFKKWAKNEIESL